MWSWLECLEEAEKEGIPGRGGSTGSQYCPIRRKTQTQEVILICPVTPTAPCDDLYQNLGSEGGLAAAGLSRKGQESLQKRVEENKEILVYLQLCLPFAI